MFNKIKVGVIMGGPSFEHEISLLTGKNILENLDKEKFLGFEIFIDREKNWFFEKEKIEPEELCQKVDVIFNALHGEFGEDGEVQKIFERHKIPYTGSGPNASFLGMAKWKSKLIFKDKGLNVPDAVKVTPLTYHFLPTFSFPWIIKPREKGSSVGVFKVNNRKEYFECIKQTFKYGQIIIVEKFISGREVSCGVIENYQGERCFPLPPVEIIPPKDFFDYNVKYNGSTKEICPASFSQEINDEIKNIAVVAHKSIGARDYSRSDMIVGDDGKIYILEINTLPGLTKESLLPKEARAVGLCFKDLITHIINLAVKRGM